MSAAPPAVRPLSDEELDRLEELLAAPSLNGEIGRAHV